MVCGDGSCLKIRCIFFGKLFDRVRFLRCIWYIYMNVCMECLVYFLIWILIKFCFFVKLFLDYENKYMR